LRDPNQHHAILMFTGCRFQIGQSHLLFILALLKVHHGYLVPAGELMDGLDVGIANLTKPGRRWDSELSLPAQELANVPYGLQPRHVSLQENPVDTSTPQCHPISQQGRVAWHGPLPFPA
jgi:hypothetical protein